MDRAVGHPARLGAGGASRPAAGPRARRRPVPARGRAHRSCGCCIDRPEGGVTLDELARVSPRAGRRPRRARRRARALHPRVLVAGAQPPAGASRALPPRHRSAGARAHARAHRRAAAVPRGAGRRRDRRRSTVHDPDAGVVSRRARRDRAGPHRVRVRRRPGAAPRHAARVRQETVMLPDLNRVIEQVSKEKGIDRADHHRGARETPCCRRRKRTFGLEQEDRGASSTPRSARSSCSRSRPSSTTSTDAENEVTLDEARREHRSGGRGRRRAAREAAAGEVRPHRRAGGEAEHHPARARRRARHHLQRVQGPQGRARLRHRAALREEEHHRQPRPHRRHPAREGADPARALSPGRPHPRLHPRRRAHQQGSADRAVAHASRAC